MIDTYAKYPVELVKGKGSKVWDSKGKEYLDFYGGHAVCLVGHCPPTVVEAITKQANTLIFYSNVFSTEPAINLAEKLAHTLAPHEYQVFFANSGSEANETALKIARRHTEKNHIISFKGSFHGRGAGPLAVTGIDHYHQFEPNLDKYTTFVDYGDLDAVRKAWTPDTAGVICEAIQSIGGIVMAAPEFYKGLETLCNEKSGMLIMDEVQTGLGRTGSYWFSRTMDITPGIITTAKGIAAGLPLSAVLVKKEISAAIKVGDHATTFGGGPVPCAAGCAVLDLVSQHGFLKEVQEKERHIRARLEGFPSIRAIRGKGLLLGIEMNTPFPKLVARCLEAGIIISTSDNPNVFRIMPPLTTSMAEIDKFADILLKVLSSY